MRESPIPRTRAVGHAAGNRRRPVISYFGRQEAAGGWLAGAETCEPSCQGPCGQQQGSLALPDMT